MQHVASDCGDVENTEWSIGRNKEMLRTQRGQSAETRRLFMTIFFSALLQNTQLGRSKKTHQFVNYTRDLNPSGSKIINVTKITEDTIRAMKLGLEGNTEKTWCILLSRQQNAGQSHNINIANRTFVNVEQIRHLGTAVIKRNLTHQKIKSTLVVNNACCHSVQNLPSSHLLYKDKKINSMV
jgi:hypothetical protein